MAEKPVNKEAKSSAPEKAVAFCLRQNKEDYITWKHTSRNLLSLWLHDFGTS